MKKESEEATEVAAAGSYNEVIFGPPATNKAQGDVDFSLYKIPSSKVLQPLSQALQQDNPAYVQGAQAGDFLLSTGQIYKSLRVRVLAIDSFLNCYEGTGLDNKFLYQVRKSEMRENGVTQVAYNYMDKEGRTLQESVRVSFVFDNDISNNGIFFHYFRSTAIADVRNIATVLARVSLGPALELKPTSEGGRLATALFSASLDIGTMSIKNKKGSWFSIGNKVSVVSGLEGRNIADFVELQQFVKLYDAQRAASQAVDYANSEY